MGAEGNVSYRTDTGFYIKKSGTSLNDGSLVRCDIDGKPMSEYGRPSMEVGFHSWIYKNSDHQVIAHTHPINTLKILCTDWIKAFATKRFFPDHVVFNGASSCVVPYATPGEDLVKAIELAVEKHGSFPNLFLLQNHGIICCAKSNEEALVMTEICEKAAEVLIGSITLSDDINALSDGAISNILNHEGEAYRNENLR